KRVLGPSLLGWGLSPSVPARRPTSGSQAPRADAKETPPLRPPPLAPTSRAYDAATALLRRLAARSNRRPASRRRRRARPGAVGADHRPARQHGAEARAPPRRHRGRLGYPTQ